MGVLKNEDNDGQQPQNYLFGNGVHVKGKHLAILDYWLHYWLLLRSFFWLTLQGKSRIGLMI